ncbi:hypothetical protein YC2023_060504 [Brassica napus]
MSIDYSIGISINILVETSTDYSIGISIDALGQALMRGLNMLIKLPTSAIAYSSNLSLVRMDSGSSKGILVICVFFWASVGHKICSAHILASPSTDGKGAPSIDSPSSPRPLPLARQTDHSSLCIQKAPKDTKITTFLQIVPEPATDEINDGARCNCIDLRRRRCRREGIELRRARQDVN